MVRTYSIRSWRKQTAENSIKVPPLNVPLLCEMAVRSSKGSRVTHRLQWLPLPLSHPFLLCVPPSPLPPQEILHQMYEQGAQFSLQDYSNAFKLLAHSQPVFEADNLQARLQALNTFFSKDSV